MKLTEFTFYKNTPFVKFQDTVHFPNNQARDTFFSSFFGKDSLSIPNLNYHRQKGTLRINIDFELMRQYNYCTWYSDFENIRYYAYVGEYAYLRDGVTEVQCVPDLVMTFTQGDIIRQYAKNVYITRQHLSNHYYNDSLLRLSTNNDLVSTTTNQYIRQDIHRFSREALMAVLQCSSDLGADFGDENAPKETTSEGTIYDGVSSPVNLYAIVYSELPDIMKKLQKYPWISRNITKISLVPADVVDTADLGKIDMNGGKITGQIFKFYNNHFSANFDLPEITYSIDQLLNLTGLSTENQHLLRKPYVNIELTNFTGGLLELDPAHMGVGAQYVGLTNAGFNNEIRVFCKGYQSRNENAVTGLSAGTYLNNALIFDKFDDIPVLVDNGSLAVASKANQRQLAKDRMLPGRVKGIVNGGIDDKIGNALSLISNFSIGGLMQKASSDYEASRDIEASIEDSRLQQNSVSKMTNSNSFAIAENFYGVTQKISTITAQEMQKVDRYYKAWGYEWNEIDELDSLDTMSIANYVQFSGYWNIDNVPVDMMNALRLIFENGVRLWHEDGTKNPLLQNISGNRRIK